MNETHTLQELCDMVVKGTREITGYDRVMVYRFDKDYNGEVFAESVREDLEPFSDCIIRTLTFRHRQGNCTCKIYYV